MAGNRSRSTRPGQIRLADAPGWLFRIGYAPDWTEEPDDYEWGNRVSAWVDAHAPHFRTGGRYSPEWIAERRRRRAEAEAAGYVRHSQELLLPPGVQRLPAAAPVPIFQEDPRRMLAGDGGYDPIAYVESRYPEIAAARAEHEALQAERALRRWSS